MKIEGKTILITGAASGLGAATAARFHRAGAQVLICDLNRKSGQELASRLGKSAQFQQTDVTNERSVSEAVRQAMKNWGALHVSVNCAGIAIAEKVLGKEGPHDLARFQKIIEVNLIGSFNVLRLSAQAMSQNETDAGGERGVVINTASVAAYEGQIGQAAYSASKAGIVGLTLPAARELARFGIRVCCIAPGIFDTPMMAGLPQAAREALSQLVPFPARLGQPEEYASLAQHIVENPMLNGETIRLDGALRMPAR